MDLHHSASAIRLDRLRSERLGRALLAALDAPTPSGVRLVYARPGRAWTVQRVRTELTTGRQWIETLTEAA
jgi:hypothetical protein